METVYPQGNIIYIYIYLYDIYLINIIGDKLGRAVLGGASLVAIGSLCFYGLGLSGEEGAIDRAM